MNAGLCVPAPFGDRKLKLDLDLDRFSPRALPKATSKSGNIPKIYLHLLALRLTVGESTFCSKIRSSSAPDR